MESFVGVSKKEMEDYVSNGLQECVRMIDSKDFNQEFAGLAQFEIFNRLRIDAHLNINYIFTVKKYHDILELIAKRRHVFEVTVREGLHSFSNVNLKS